MKQITRKRSKPHSLDRSIPQEKLNELASGAKYVGSSYHKAGKNPLVPDQWKISPRPTASICPSNIRDKATVTGWLQKAIKKGAVSTGAKCVWYIGDEGMFEASASGNNEYHGYPVEQNELSQDVIELYAKN